MIKVVKGKPRLEWVKKSGTRNEPLDLRNYATAAVQILSPNFDVLATKIRSGVNYMKRNTGAKSATTGQVWTHQHDGAWSARMTAG